MLNLKAVAQIAQFLKQRGWQIIKDKNNLNDSRDFSA